MFYPTNHKAKISLKNQKIIEKIHKKSQNIYFKQLFNIDRDILNIAKIKTISVRNDKMVEKKTNIKNFLNILIKFRLNLIPRINFHICHSFWILYP